MTYKKGDQYLLPTKEQLIEWGWIQSFSPEGVLLHLHHKDFHTTTRPQIILSLSMLVLLGKWVTVKCQDHELKEYYNIIMGSPTNYVWPLELFDKQQEAAIPSVLCIEGMTSIDGWFICKHCGINLRKIK